MAHLPLDVVDVLSLLDLECSKCVPEIVKPDSADPSLPHSWSELAIHHVVRI